MAVEYRKLFQAQIIRPTGNAYKQNIYIFVFPAYDGERAVLAGHAPFLCNLGTGMVRICNEHKKWEIFFVEGGSIEYKKGELTLLTQQVIQASAIDRALTEKRLKSIEEHPLTHDYGREQQQQDLRRHKLMLKVADRATKSSAE